MKVYKAPIYTREQIESLDEKEIRFPYSTNFDAIYNGEKHQYVLTSRYFSENGVNLQKEVKGNDPDKVKNFLNMLSTKVYNYIYRHSKSTKNQIDYLIAKRGLRTYPIYEYRQSFLEAMFLEGEYLIGNGDISKTTGVDLDTMQNISADVIRNQDRDMDKECIGILMQLGLNYYGRYNFIPTGKGKEW